MAGFKVTGLKELERELNKMASDIPKQVDDEIKKIAQEILDDAISRVHVSSGELKASAFITKIEGGYTIGFSAFYAAYEEFGTGGLVNVPNGYEDFAMQFKVPGGRLRNGNPHPFLFPPFLKRKESIAVELSVQIQKYLDKL